MQHLTPQQFIDKLEKKIAPGRRGAPDRRDIHARVKKAHYQHMDNLDCGKWRNLKRYNTRYNPNDGYNVHGGFLRHGPSDPMREKTGRLQKMHKRLMSAIHQAPAEYLIRITQGLNINMHLYGYTDLEKYLILYPYAKAEDRIWRGKIYEYAESTEWNKYGSRSYPRTVDRRIIIYSRTGHKLYRYLNNGERAESALDDCIKGRADRRKKRTLAIKKRKQSEINRVKPAYKIVEKNGKLRSVFNPDFVYPLKRWVTEKPAKGHESGIYCYATADEAVSAVQRNEVFSSAWTAGKTLVLCECKRRGREIMYGNKIAVESLLVSRIIETVGY
jgi:hypothetical protein